MDFKKICFLTFFALCLSRFIPHPPNFTSLIAISFYIPALFGRKYIFIVIGSLIFSDFVIGTHSTMLFTSGSVLLIGILSSFFDKSLLFRINGALLSALIFFIITNFGVWLKGYYGFTIEGLINCYILALPFFGYTIVSTFIFSALIETIIKFRKPFVKIFLS